MWLCERDRPLNARRNTGGAARRVAAAALLGLLVAGCADGSGFRPMYAQVGSSPRLDEKMAAMQIAPIPSRVGQRIRNELIFNNTGGGLPAEPRYRLDISIRESLGATNVKATGEAMSSVYSLDASFTLIDMVSKKVLLRGTSHGRANFDRFQSIYSNVRAREDAENRAAKAISDDLKVRLAAFLSREQS